MAKRPVGKKLAAKAAAKDTKKAKAEKVETKAEPIVETVEDTTFPTPVEPTAQNIMATLDEIAEHPVVDDPTENETAEAIDASENAEVADAKNLSVQTPAASNEAKPADEVMEKTNEDLERQ